jgi:hypothetical protein
MTALKRCLATELATSRSSGAIASSAAFDRRA